MGDIPEVVARAYQLDDAEAERITSGWINRTYGVTRGGAPLVLQRLHPAFAAPVNDDIDAVTAHLADAGLLTPRVVRTVGGATSVEADGCWRALTHVPGRTLDRLETPARARSAGKLVGRFHRAVDGLDHAFAFTRPGAHDTPAHLAKLRRLAGSGDERADAAAHDVLRDAEALPAIGPLPRRIVHGDLKATNLRFDDAGDEAIAILDLDTLAHGDLAVEMGDALRSWCNTRDEADPDAAFDGALCVAALEGWLEGVGDRVDPAEVLAIPKGVETIAVELASRFAADVYEDSYFGYDPARFDSRRAHNLARVSAQLGIARSVRAQRAELEQALRRQLAR